jgi:hypothetical protein
MAPEAPVIPTINRRGFELIGTEPAFDQAPVRRVDPNSTKSMPRQNRGLSDVEALR